MARREIVGSILHGAYGDYYEQMICLRDFRRRNPGVRLVVFFASEVRRQEMAVFDLSFADEVLPASRIPDVDVDRFLQFQIFDPDLQKDILSALPPTVLAKFDLRHNRKPWTELRTIDFGDPAAQVGLGPLGEERLARCYADNGLAPRLMEERPTIGFLWRYRRRGGAVSARWQIDEDTALRWKSRILDHLAGLLGAHLIVAGMNVVTNDENRERTDNKFSSQRLDLPAERVTYLRGLSWGLELTILSRCTLCVVMSSGFSEALWLRRNGRGMVLVDAPPHYVAKALWNRMPFFELNRPSGVLFQLRQPHTPERVERYLRARGVIPR